MLKVSNLYFSYTKEYNILHNINFCLHNKETMFILGEQESGRSSLIRILLGIETNYKGEVIYDNMPVDRKLFKTTVSVGFLPEKMACMEGKSVYANLKYVLKIRKVNKAMQEIKINNALKCYGLETLKDVKMNELGRYDRLKVALARLSMRKLDYIFVDDIFKDLTGTETKSILTEIKKLINVNDASAIIVSDNIDNAKHLKCKKYKLEFGSLDQLEDANV